MMKTFLAATVRLFTTGTTKVEQFQPSPEMELEAKKNPNGWVYVIRGNFGPNDAVPPEAIVGAWKVDASGKIVENSFQPNPKYKC
jgi:hypothetical protein